MSNKRVSELVELTAGEISSNDLLLIVDASAKESKKLEAGQLLDYIEGSGSFTATFAVLASTASFIDPNNVGLIASASHGITSRTASFALTAASSTTASFALTASFLSGSTTTNLASSASFLIFSPSNGTASFAMTASLARNATNAANLIYTGANNGTASYAVRAGFSDTAGTATTASYFNPVPGSASFATASVALEAVHAQDADTADSATTAASADFLNFDGVTPNGTASYAMLAKTASYSLINVTSSYTVFSVMADTASLATTASFALTASLAVTASRAVTSSNSITSSYTTFVSDRIQNWGMFTSSTHNLTISQINTMSIAGVSAGGQTTLITAMGTVRVPFTSSNFVTGIIKLSVRNQANNTETLFDSSSLNFTLGGLNTADSGSSFVPYSLMGQSSLSGSYVLFVSCSSDVELSSNRVTRFDINSLATSLSIV